MALVYTHSLCNLLALEAHHSEQGMISPCKASENVPAIVVAKWPGEERAFHVSTQGYWNNQVDESILLTRAWVQQERLLPPRQLHFGKIQHLWECLELHACETFPHGVGPKSLRQSLFPNLLTLAEEAKDGKAKEYSVERQNRIPTDMTVPVSLDPLEQLWRRIVPIYTACNLTKSRDKLVALSGVAKVLCDTFGEEYYAGLWKHVLFKQLLWTVTEGRRSELYRAPSWSWANMDGQIDFPKLSGKASEAVTLIGIQVEPRTGDSTGELVGGSLTVTCFVYPVSYSVDSKKFESPRFGLEHSTFQTAFPDIKPTSTDTELYCVPLFKSQPEGTAFTTEASLYCLILRRSDRIVDAFERWGTLQVRSFPYSNPRKKPKKSDGSSKRESRLGFVVHNIYLYEVEDDGVDLQTITIV